MEQLYHELIAHINSFLTTSSIVMISHTCSKFKSLRLPSNQPILSALTDAVSSDFTSVAKWLIENNYHISDRAVYITIERANFIVLNLIINKSAPSIDKFHLLHAVKSKNLSMVNFIHKRLTQVFNYSPYNLFCQELLVDIAVADVVDIFVKLVPYEYQNIPRTLEMLVFHNSVNIIENIRLRLKNSSNYDIIVRKHAIVQKNTFMIEYFDDNNYEPLNEPIQFVNLVLNVNRIK